MSAPHVCSRRHAAHPADECCHDLPPIQSTRAARLGGTLASALLPPLFLAAWTYVPLARLLS